MDGSLASLFLNPVTMESWLLQCDEEWSCFDTQSLDDLKYKLTSASMELHNVKSAATANDKSQKAKLYHLQELLSIVKKERDEAHEECRKLQEHLSQQRQSGLPPDSSCSYMHCSSKVSSTSSSPWSLNILEEHLNNGSFGDCAKTCAPMELQQTLQGFSQSCNDGLQALFSIESTHKSVLGDFEPQFSLEEVLEQDLSFEDEPSLNLGELEQDAEGLGMCKSTQTTTCSLSRQPSSVSCSASPTGREQQANVNHVREVDLPEPFKGDPQMMLSSLPETGKLLQAVMQAGPLLEMLLLAGPLPQWQHPPPAFNTVDILMVPSDVISPYPSHMPGCLIQDHAEYHTPIDNGTSSPATRVSIANADTICSRTKKVCRLNPASPHQNQLMHMCGEGMFEIGVSYPPPTIC